MFADTVFLGAAVPVYGPETPANKKWYSGHAATPHDPAAAQALLASIGLTDRNGDGDARRRRRPAGAVHARSRRRDGRTSNAAWRSSATS